MENEVRTDDEIYLAQAIFKPQPRFFLVLPEICEKTLKSFSLKQWGSSVSRFDIVSEDNLFQFSVDHNSAAATARTPSAWRKYLPSLSQAFEVVFDTYGLKELDQMVFRRDSFAETGMDFAEMTELGLTSLLNQPGQLLRDAATGFGTWKRVSGRSPLRLQQATRFSAAFATPFSDSLALIGKGRRKRPLQGACG